MHVQSRLGRAGRPSASDPACTSAPPVSAGCTTWSRRSSTTRWTRPWRARRQDRGHAAGRRRGPDHRQRPRHPGRQRIRSRSGPRSRSCSPRCTPAASSTASPTRCPAACTASASRWSTRCRPGSRSRSARTASSGASPTGQRADRAAQQGRADHRDRHDHHVLAGRRGSSRPRTYTYETLVRRLQEMAFLNAALADHTARDERDEASGEDLIIYEGGLRDFVKHLGQRDEEAPCRNRRSTSRPRPTPRPTGIWVEVAMQWIGSYAESVHTFANTISTRGRHAPGRVPGPR